MERIVGKRFKLARKLGAGSFGQIYLGEDLKTGREVAIKLESSNSRSPQLSYESKLYRVFEGSCSVPRMYWYGSEGHYNIMAIELMGKSLEDELSNSRRHLTLKTVLMLADQMISSVEYIHKKDYIHRDIKPDNFVMGVGKNKNKVFIIDFGLSKRYRDQHTQQHIGWVDGKSLTGTARYASVNALRGIEQSRRDDMEALGYVWMYLLKGSLPWMGLRGKDQYQKYDRICEVKQKTPIEELCRGYPNEFKEYLESVKSLHFTEEPKYSEYRRKFRELFNRLGYKYDGEYDWSEKRERNDHNLRTYRIERTERVERYGAIGGNGNQRKDRAPFIIQNPNVANANQANINQNQSNIQRNIQSKANHHKTNLDGKKDDEIEVETEAEDGIEAKADIDGIRKRGRSAEEDREKYNHKDTDKEEPYGIAKNRHRGAGHADGHAAGRHGRGEMRKGMGNIRRSQLPRWMVDLD